MTELITRIWENLIARTEGPMHFRFLIQPTMSLIFTILAARRDVKNNAAPYFWRFLTSAGQRPEIAKEAWKDVGKVFLAGLTLDIIYQLIVVFKLKTETRFYPLESVLVAFLLALIPYIVSRGPVSRILRLFNRKKDPTNTQSGPKDTL